MLLPKLITGIHYHSSKMHCSGKFPYPSHRTCFFVRTLPPLRKFWFGFIISFLKLWLLKPPSTLNSISNSLYFLKMHNIKRAIVLNIWFVKKKLHQCFLNIDPMLVLQHTYVVHLITYMVDYFTNLTYSLPNFNSH